MASVHTEANGRRRVQVICPDGIRRSVRLGTISEREAGRIADRVQQLADDLRANALHDPSLVAWVRTAAPVVVKRLQRIGLTKLCGQASMTLEAFLKKVFENLSV